MLRRFEEAVPDCKLYFSFHDIEELEESLENGTLDGFLFSDAQSLMGRFTCQRLFAIRQSFICSKPLLERYGTVGDIIAHSPFVTKSNSPAYAAKIRQHCRHAFHQEFLSVHLCKTLSEQLLTVSLSQGFAILPMPESDAYPGLSVIPGGDVFTEHPVMAYR
mgnify:FL=1